MNVLILGHSYYAKENRKQLTEIAKMLDNDLDVVLPRPTGEHGLFDYSADDIPAGGPGFRCHVLDSWPTGDFLRGFLRHFKPCLDRIGPDVVHCEWAPQTVPALQVAMFKRFRHGDFVLTGLLRQPVVNFKDRWYGIPLSGVTSWMLKEFDGLQVNTTLAERAFYEAMNINQSARPFTFRIYQTGVDTGIFRPPDAGKRSQARKALGFKDDELVVGYCGRFIGKKGVLDLIEAVTSIDDAAKLHLALLGAGPLDGEIRGSAENSEVPISVFPVRPHAEVANFMQSLDIFVLPSQVREGWVEHDAHVAVEAMACGLPVVGTTSGATKEVLSEAGVLVPPGRPGKLADAIRYLISNPEEAHRIGARARRRAVECFSHESVARRLVTAWKRLTRACV